MMAKHVIVDDACLQEGDTLDCVGHRRRQRETSPGTTEAETAVLEAVPVTQSANHPSASRTGRGGLCTE